MLLAGVAMLSLATGFGGALYGTAASATFLRKTAQPAPPFVRQTAGNEVTSAGTASCLLLHVSDCSPEHVRQGKCTSLRLTEIACGASACGKNPCFPGDIFLPSITCIVLPSCTSRYDSTSLTATDASCDSLGYFPVPCASTRCQESAPLCLPVTMEGREKNNGTDETRRLETSSFSSIASSALSSEKERTNTGVPSPASPSSSPDVSSEKNKSNTDSFFSASSSPSPLLTPPKSRSSSVSPEKERKGSDNSSSASHTSTSEVQRSEDEKKNKPVFVIPEPEPPKKPEVSPAKREANEAKEAAVRRAIETKLISRNKVEEQRVRLLANIEEAVERLAILAAEGGFEADIKDEWTGTIRWLKEKHAAYTGGEPTLEDLQIQAEAVQVRLAETHARIKEALQKRPEPVAVTPNRLIAAADRIFAALPRTMKFLQDKGIVIQNSTVASFLTAHKLYEEIRAECVARKDACERIGETVPHLERVLGDLKEAVRKAKRDDLLPKMQEMLKE